MQLIDVAFMGPFKTYYIHEVEQGIWRNPGSVITVYRNRELFDRVYMKAAAKRPASSAAVKTHTGYAVCLCSSVQTK
jgi:hypothetical protein